MVTIESVAVRALNLPLQDPFEIALGTQTEASNVVVRVETEDGVVGVGEGSPLPVVTGETQASALSIARETADLLVGHDLAAYRDLVDAVRTALPGNGAALLAVETAILDAYCRRRDLPLAALFGGGLTSLRTDLNIPIAAPETAIERASEAIDRGYDVLKIKCGDSVEASVARIKAVAEAAPSTTLTVDANQGFSPAATRQFARQVERAGITLRMIEQPVPASDLTGLAEVREALSTPVVADESVFDPTDAMAVCRADAADVLNVKLAKSGLLGGAQVAAVARAANRDVMIGCMLESAVGIHASGHLVAGLGGVTHVDLDGNRLLAADLIDRDPGPTIDLTGPGHGIDPARVWRRST